MVSSGGSAQPLEDANPPGCKPLPLDADPLPPGRPPDADPPDVDPPSSRQTPTPLSRPPRMQSLPPPPPWTKGMTRACENITFPQLLLRAVRMLGTWSVCTISSQSALYSSTLAVVTIIGVVRSKMRQFHKTAIIAHCRVLNKTRLNVDILERMSL